MICQNCKTVIEPRAVVFGKIGKVMLEACECEASKFVIKHQTRPKKKK